MSSANNPSHLNANNPHQHTNAHSGQNVPPITAQKNQQYASVQISDALLKISLYLQKLIVLQQSSQQSENTFIIDTKCKKILRLCYQSFVKYGDNQEFAKGSFEAVKLIIINKKSYYCLYLLDLMLKNSKYVIKMAKKQVESMMKMIWQKIWTQFQNQQKLQNLKIMIKCWGYIYSQKMQQNLRKWLQSKYNIKRIQLRQQNQKAIKHIYGEKSLSQNGKNKQKDNKISQALLNSLVNDNDQQEHAVIQNTYYNRSNSARDEYYLKQGQFMGNYPGTNVGYNNKSSANTIPYQMKKTGSSSSLGKNLNNSNQKEKVLPSYANQKNDNSSNQASKKINLQKFDKSLLQAFDIE